MFNGSGVDLNHRITYRRVLLLPGRAGQNQKSYLPLKLCQGTNFCENTSLTSFGLYGWNICFCGFMHLLGRSILV